jgi:hypothetical protein
MFFQFITHSIVLQLQGLFQKHLSPHQFGVLTLKGYEAIPFSIETFLDLHLDWAVMYVDIKNAFNNVFRVVICKELCDV